MAIVRTSGLISSLTGKLGGSVFQRGQSGIIIRNNPQKISSANPLTNSKKRFGSRINDMWQGLTAEQKQVWVRAVGFFNPKQKNNNERNITPFNYYYRTNFYLLSALTSPLNNPVFDAQPSHVRDATFFFAAGDLQVTFDPAPNTGDTLMLIFATPVVNPSLNNINNKYRQLFFAPTNNATTIISTAYFNLFGNIPDGGSTVWFKWASLNINNGIITPYQIVKQIL